MDIDMLAERINILHSFNQINEATKHSLFAVIDYFKQHHAIQLTEDNGSTMITHLAVAITRQLEGESAAAMDEVIFSELKNEPEFGRALQLWNEIQPLLPVPFTEGEQQYMILHLITLLKKVS